MVFKQILFVFFLSSYLFADLLYVGRGNDNGTLVVIDTTTNTVLTTIPNVFTFPAESNGIVFNPNGKFVYTISDNFFFTIDVATNSLILQHAGVGPGIAITPSGEFVCLAERGVGVVTTYSTKTGLLVHFLAPPEPPYGIAITPDSKFVYTTSEEGHLYVISIDTNTVTQTINLGFPDGPTGIAITPNGQFAYVISQNSNNILVVSTASNTVVATIPVDTGSAGVAVTPNGQFVYATNQSSNSVTVISTASNTVVATIPVGSQPLGIAVTPDGQFAYVANKNDGTLSVISTASNSVVGSPIAVGNNPDCLAFQPILLTSLTGSQKKNDFGLTFEFFNYLEWQNDPSPQISGYVVYRNGIRIAVLDAQTFSYKDHNQMQGVATSYLVAPLFAGAEGAGLTIVIR